MNDTNINVVELLMQIKEDVSSIKTDMNNLKDAQRVEKENINNEFRNVRAEYTRDLSELKNYVTVEMKDFQTVQNELVKEVSELKQADVVRDAKKWKKTVAYLCTGLGGIIVAKLPDILLLLMEVKK